MEISYKQLKNDLFAEFECKCPKIEYKDDPILSGIIKTKIEITGYNDSYFFDIVNKEPREIKCECGRVYDVQWLRGKVMINYKSNEHGKQSNVPG